MPRYFTAAELERLRELREVFLESREDCSGGWGAYWESEEDLALYDETFGRRIGWKWEAVLGELERRGRLLGGASVLDWGCGTGIASRRYLAALDARGVERVHLWDRDRSAREFAARRVHDEQPGLEVLTELPGGPPDVLLVSHVLGELDLAGLAELLELAGRCGVVLWVEPGTPDTSRRLGEARARLARSLDVLGPCTHQAACGALAPGAGWCHFFARAPQEIYTQGRWAEFGRELEIDLRSLPYAYLALAARGALAQAGARGGRARLIGRPRLSRGRALLDVCDENGVRELAYLQRTDKALFRSLGDTAGEPWIFEVEVEGRRITALERRE